MKIAIVISTPEMGGAQRVAINLARWINDNTETECIVVSLQDAVREAYNVNELPYFSLKGKHLIKGLIDFINKNKIEVLLTMGVPLSIYTVPACLITKTKNIISERNDPSHFAGKTTTKIVSRFLMKNAAGYVFQTTGAKEYYADSIKRRSVIIPNPLFSVENMPNEVFRGERKKTIVSVGRLNKQKNQDMLIEAFSEIVKTHPAYNLVIWGDGPEKDSLAKRINELELTEKVLLPGTTKDVAQEIYDNSIFVLSSDFEGMPNALIEAMALGLPCISTDCPCGGPKDLIEHGKNGFLIRVGDTEDLIHHLNLLIENPDISNNAGVNAFHIRNKLNSDRICKEWYEYILSI
jgi:glycosyltransferase involved in cell wall biosynthesis